MGLALLGLAIIALIPAVFIVDGLIEGEVQTDMWPYRRSEEPIHFWTMIAMYGGFIVWLAYEAGSLVFNY